MKFEITDKSRVDFVAYAPMHTFKGWSIKGLSGQFDIDFDGLAINKLEAAALNEFFDTGDASRNKAMVDFFKFDQNKESSFEMTEFRDFEKTGDNQYRVTVIGILDFVGIKRQLPVTMNFTRTDDELKVSLKLKWSFKGFGIKAPRLLFLTVRDIVDISAELVLAPC
ncbi:MAG: hypothetical protein CSB24_02895 [Deltaproteobacteria bacterium]|nr:MAG: hypothetical protein CSB24_02895 [Deltaproteobacteria bacterium]